ncbi:MAG: HesA/MoeB/ThiF family protein [Deltaproteobacteria bacterium]|nr:HesA/MoeB/ThiF family protein [Deltaproteobacteria bacterium]
MFSAPTDERNDAAALAAGHVLVVGVGALGCPAAWTLAAAGVGRLTLVDPDRVELSNLHRQVLHSTATLGQPKVESAAARLRAAFPAVTVETRAEAVTAANLPAYFAAADFVIDATDGVAAKFLLNDGAVACRRPYSHAGVLGFLGQTLTVLPGRSACYRCLFPEPPPADEVPSCQSAGVIGAIAGVIGAVQAGEALAHLTGQVPSLADHLLSFDGLTGRWRRIRVARNPRCPRCAAVSPAALDAAGRAG